MKLRAPGARPVLVPPVLPNAGEEVAYLRELEKLIKAMHTSVLYWVGTAWRRAGLPKTEVAEDASPKAALVKALKQLGEQWHGNFTASAKRIARKFASGAMSSSDREFSAALRKAGFTVRFQSTPTIDAELGQIVQENVDLIKSIPQQYFSEIEEIVRESVEKGRALDKLTDLLEDRYGVTRNRAVLIARDQNNKATARTHRLRQKDVGIKQAQWVHTPASVHPRPEHEMWDGKVYDIDTGMYSDEDGEFVWPGTPINCGCTCMSVVPGAEEEK